MFVRDKPWPAFLFVALLSSVVAACAGTKDPGGAGTGGTHNNNSGGGAGTNSGGGGQGGGGIVVGTGGSECGHMVFDVDRKPVEIFVVFDRSASMKDGLDDKMSVSSTNPTKWSQLIPAMMMTLAQSDPTISWGMKTFPEDTSNNEACDNGSVTTKIDVSIAMGNAAALSSAVGAITDEGDGTPTGAAIRVATKYLQDLSATDDSRKYILLATDGEPSCMGSVGGLTKVDSVVARPDAVAAVTDAANAGFHTFVVGVGTKATDATTLNALAVAGLEPSPDLRPGANRYFQASNQAQLVTTLESIVNPVASNCVFPLNAKPPVPENIAVKVNGTKSPQDPAHLNGWDYTDPSLTGVQVYGSWCDMIKANGNKVEITYGCLNEIIP